MSKRDIEFFFEVAEKSAEDSNWKYRRKFWEAYLPYIENTWVALGPKAKSLVKKDEYDFGELLGGSINTSVFLIKMRNYVFIEWCPIGACRVYRECDFPLKFGANFYKASEIRTSNYVHWQKHTGSEKYHWQDELATWISLNLGIQPAKSYRLN